MALRYACRAGFATGCCAGFPRSCRAWGRAVRMRLAASSIGASVCLMLVLCANLRRGRSESLWAGLWGLGGCTSASDPGSDGPDGAERGVCSARQASPRQCAQCMQTRAGSAVGNGGTATRMRCHARSAAPRPRQGHSNQLAGADMVRKRRALGARLRAALVSGGPGRRRPNQPLGA